jgi:perosamine synthetase
MDSILGKLTPGGLITVVHPVKEGLDSRLMDHERIPLSRPSLRIEDFEAVTAVLKSGNLVQGSEVAKLEAFLANHLGSHYAIAVSNGTAALELSIMSLGIGINDEVIVPPYSFVATANAVALTGATPVFADVCDDQLNICADSVRSRITKRTKAIVVVHEFGFTANLEKLLKVAKDFNLPLVEDAACALGSRAYGAQLGTLGAIGCFSFHPRKIVTSGEGGLVVTSNPQVADFIRSMRNHGLDERDNVRRYSRIGYNFRMTDFGAALLTSQLKRLDSIIYSRNQIANLYTSEISKDLVRFPHYLPQETKNWQTFPLLLPSEETASQFIHFMEKQNIAAIRPAQHIPSEPSYATSTKHTAQISPNALHLWKRCVAVPLLEDMTENEISRVIGSINEFH